MSKQLWLSFNSAAAAPEMPAREIDSRASLRPLDIRRAVIAWLLGEEVNGLATKVPTRISRFKADVAGFWTRQVRNPHIDGPTHILRPDRTIIVECRRKRQDCWPDVGNSGELLPKLRELKQRRQQLEAEIREQEPHLREGSVLFAEYAEWRYEETRNSEYPRLRRDLKRTEHALYRGSRFESIRAAQIADFLYLAVPSRTVHPHELADGWGLLWVNRDLEVEVIVPAGCQNCETENRLHLVQNTAAAAMQHVLFTHGLATDNDDQVHFLPIPRRRRAKADKNGD